MSRAKIIFYLFYSFKIKRRKSLKNSKNSNKHFLESKQLKYFEFVCYQIKIT